MSYWLVGGFASRSGLKSALPAFALMMAAAVGLGAGSAWADNKAQGGSKSKLEASAGPVVGYRAIEPASPEQQPIFAALNQNMRQTMASYDYDISNLHDPFLPIEAVRDTLDKSKTDRLAFTQLKLVAIAMPSGSGAVASFEDGAGVSYILRVGDQFGRSQGLVAAIEPSQVTIVEPPRGSSKEPIKTIMKLNVLDTTTGLTRHEQEMLVQ